MMAGMQDAKGNLLLAQHMTAGEVYLLRPGTILKISVQISEDIFRG